jgi:hypothetical protein
MGIDSHGFNFLKYAHNFGDFGPTVTIGRQSLHLHPRQIRKAFAADSRIASEDYCEGMLTRHFGATRIDSLDASLYENATIRHDMNRPLPESQYGKYQTVFDGGCLEHIYDIPQALKNVSLLCRPGGQILHVLPANSFCGHGFWQFSPELFFSLYSEANGYAGTEVFLANTLCLSHWFRVSRPEQGRRAEIQSLSPMYLLVRTQKQGEHFSHQSITQSDYLHNWEQKPKKVKSKDRLPSWVYGLRKSYWFSFLWVNVWKKCARQYFRFGAAPSWKTATLSKVAIEHMLTSTRRAA